MGSRHGVEGAVAAMFFCDANVNLLHEAVRYNVYVGSQGKAIIGRQSDAELKTIMRSIYFTHGRNLRFEVRAQVRALNAKVLEYAVPEVLSAMAMQAHYLQSTDRTAAYHMPRATMTSGARTEHASLMR